MAGEYAGSRGVVIVDTAGTARGEASGVERGSGSRVELLASGANTSLTATTIAFATFNVPAWAHSVYCTATITAASGAGASNLKGQIFGYDAASNLLVATALSETGVIASPGVGSSMVMDMGPQAMVFGSTGTTTTAIGALVHGGMSIAPRRISFNRVASATPATSWSIWFECYGIG